MRPLTAVLTALLAVFGIGVLVPGIGATASACTCAYQGDIPNDLVVVHGVVEKQVVGARTVDIQVRVTSMYGAPPERTTVIRAESGSSSSCGSEFRDGQEVRMVVERGGPRWEYRTCANAVFGRQDAPDFTGTPPGQDAEEHRLPGPPMSWFYSGLRLEALAIGAAALAILAITIIVWRRDRRRS